MNLTTKELEIVEEALRQSLKDKKDVDGKEHDLYTRINNHLTVDREKVYVQNVKFFKLVDNEILPSRKTDVCYFYDAFAHETDDGISKKITLYEAKGGRNFNYEKMECSIFYMSWLGGDHIHEVYVEKFIPTHTEQGLSYFQIVLRPTGKNYLVGEK